MRKNKTKQEVHWHCTKWQLQSIMNVEEGRSKKIRSLGSRWKKKTSLPCPGTLKFFPRQQNSCIDQSLCLHREDSDFPTPRKLKSDLKKGKRSGFGYNKKKVRKVTVAEAQLQIKLTWSIGPSSALRRLPALSFDSTIVNWLRRKKSAAGLLYVSCRGCGTGLYLIRPACPGSIMRWGDALQLVERLFDLSLFINHSARLPEFAIEALSLAHIGVGLGVFLMTGY